LLATGCQSNSPASPDEESWSDRLLIGIEAQEPRDGATGVDLLPRFAWRIPRHPNRVNTIIFNLFRADEIEGEARFIRVFDGPIEAFRLNEGQEGMPAMGIGRLEPDTDYIWKLSITYQDVDDVHTGEWRFHTRAMR
jgi:hypothetical protein